MVRDSRTGRWRSPEQTVTSLADLYGGPDMSEAPQLKDFSDGGGWGMWGPRSPSYDYAGFYAAKKQYRDDYRRAGMEYLQGELDQIDARMEGLFNDSNAGYDEILGQIQEEMSRNQGMRQQYEELYMPLREDVVRASREGITADYTGAMSQAEAETQNQFNRAREENVREMARYGMNPSDGRFISDQRALRIAEAAARGAQRTRAYRDEKARVEDTNFNRMMAGLSTAPNPEAFDNTALLNTSSNLQSAKALDKRVQADYLGKSAAGLGQMMAQFNATQGGGNPPRRINGIMVG